MAGPLSDIERLTGEVCERWTEVTSLYLFGSASSGHTHQESDLDLAVLFDWLALPTARDRFEAGLRLSADFSAAMHRNDVDLVVLNDAPPHLARAITTGGRRLIVRDAGADHAFTRTAMLRAADVEPFLERTRRTKLDALARPGGDPHR